MRVSFSIKKMATPPVKLALGNIMNTRYFLFATLVCASALAASDGKATPSSGCRADSAFGLRYGSVVPSGAKRVSGGDASTFYAVTPIEPDPQFDSYQARVDTENAEIFEVIATKVITISPPLGEPPLSSDLREAGKQRALAFALQYIAQLPTEQRTKIKQNKYGTANWTLWLSDDVEMTISAGFAWDVTVSCKDARGENRVAKRVLPELFEKREK